VNVFVREREREKQRERKGGGDIYIYIYIVSRQNVFSYICSHILSHESVSRS
jgi:hypothetical protein